MQKNALEKKELKEITCNNAYNKLNFNPNSEIESPQIQDGINNLFPSIFSGKVIIASLPS